MRLVSVNEGVGRPGRGHAAALTLKEEHRKGFFLAIFFSCPVTDCFTSRSVDPEGCTAVGGGGRALKMLK